MTGPKRASDLLKDVLREAQTLAGRQEFTNALAEVVGPETAPHCWVVGFRAGRLVVEVDSAPLYSELTGFRREQIRLAMNERLDKQKIAQLNFRMGGTGHV